MKPVIIITIAFVLLIPIPIFAQEFGGETGGGLDDVKETSENLKNTDNGQEFFENVFLILAPVIITLVGSKYIVNSWQIQKEKSELRKNLLSEFDEGFSQLGQYMFELFYKIRYAYVDQSKIKIGTDPPIDKMIVFPEDVNQQPLAKFKDELIGLLEAFSKSNSAQTKFTSSLVLYFDNASEIMQECTISNEFGKDLNILLHQIINSTNKTDFINSCIQFNEINKKQYQKNNFIRIMLVYEKIKNPEKGMNQEFIEGFKKYPDFQTTSKSKTKKSKSQTDSSSQDKNQQDSEQQS